MADNIAAGFGASPATVLGGAIGDLLQHFVASQERQMVRVERLLLSIVQVNGAAFLPNAYVGVSILRGVIDQNQPVSLVVRPVIGGVTAGLLTADKIPRGFELLGSMIYRVANQPQPIDFAENLTAVNGQSIIFIVTPLTDAGVIPPSPAGGDALVQTTIVGYVASLNDGLKQRSMPRFDFATPNVGRVPE